MTSSDIFKSDLSLLQTIYGVSLVLGYREIAAWTYDSGRLFVKSGDASLLALKLLAAASLVLLGLRFFWATGNIRRYVLRHRPRANDRKLVTLVHFPVLLFHAFLFYILSKEAAGITGWNVMEQRSSYLVWTIVAFLLVNSSWLILLIAGRIEREPELLWIKNNLAIAAFIAVEAVLCRFIFHSVPLAG